MSKNVFSFKFKLVFFSLLLIIWGIIFYLQREKPVSLEEQMGNPPTNRHQIKIIVDRITSFQPDENQNKHFALSCNSFFLKHLNMFPIAQLEKLLEYHPVIPEIIENTLIKLINRYPAKDYFPSRDDQPVIIALQHLIKWKYDSDKLLLIISSLLDRIPPLGDANSKVRTKIAKFLPEISKSPKIKKILITLIKTLKNQNYRVNSMAAESLGKTGVSSAEATGLLIKLLFLIKDDVSAARNAAFALSVSTGKARMTASLILAKLVRYSGRIINEEVECSEVFSVHSKHICNLFTLGLQKGWLANNPYLFEETSIRVLSYMHAKFQLLALHKEYNRTSLKIKWVNQLNRFAEKTNQEKNSKLNLTEIIFQSNNISDFNRDYQIRSILLEHLNSFGRILIPLPEDFSFGEESRFSLDTANLAAEMKPNADSVKIFIDNVTKGTVWITSSSYYSLLRTIALNKTLDNPELSTKLAEIWNSETSSRDQWQKTRKYWQPQLLKEVNHFKNCKEDKNCLTPNELYRLKLLKLLYHHLNYKLLAEFLPQIKKLNILKQLTPPEFLKNNPEFVSRPWSKKVEKLRLEAASELISKTNKDFKQIENFMFKCKEQTACYA
nr:hypothetical protein [Deltaproteobacteria bacterium]